MAVTFRGAKDKMYEWMIALNTYFVCLRGSLIALWKIKKQMYSRDSVLPTQLTKVSTHAK